MKNEDLLELWALQERCNCLTSRILELEDLKRNGCYRGQYVIQVESSSNVIPNHYFLFTSEDLSQVLPIIDAIIDRNKNSLREAQRTLAGLMSLWSMDTKF
jgi:hypothetical protein